MNKSTLLLGFFGIIILAMSSCSSHKGGPSGVRTHGAGCSDCADCGGADEEIVYRKPE